MRKILFGLLGLLFSISANAACNLFNGYNSAAVTLDETNNVLSNKLRDTRTDFQLQVQMQKTDNSYFVPISQADIATGKQTFTFNVPEDIKIFVIKHNGVTQDIRFTPDTLLPSAGTYTLSFDVLSNDPTIVGGIQLQNIKLERGDTATAYTPYYANCVERCANMYDYNYRNSEHYELVDGNTLRNTSTTNNTRFQLSIYDSVNREMAASNVFTTPGNYNVKFNVVRDNNTMSMYHSGSNGNLGFFTSRKINPGEYVLSFDLLSANPSVVGGLQLKNISLRPAYCSEIQVASTKYAETVFNPLNTALQSAISVVDSVVSRTITQAASIATLQSGKQTRPADDTCPAYKQCLLVEDEQGVPHWYQITDPFRDFFTPILATGTNSASFTNNRGYTQLEYIESTGTQYIDTGVVGNMGIAAEIKLSISDAKTSWILGSRTGPQKRFGAIILSDDSGVWDFGLNTDNTFGQYVVERDYVINFVTNLNTPSTMSINNGNSIAVSEVNNTDLQLYLFNVNYNGTSTSGQGFIGKIYYSKIWNNGTLVRNFVPVIDNATGKIGMYDTVGGRFYGNAATSGNDFTPGPIVENDADVPASTWSATWAANATTGVSAGTVTGEAFCNGVSGAYATAATAANLSDSNWDTVGKECWCKVSGLNVGGEYSTTDKGQWVHGDTRDSLASCTYYCSYNCGGLIYNEANFRSKSLVLTD